jgi:hypothetical protein
LQGTQGNQGLQGLSVQGLQGTLGPVAGSANQVIYKNASNVATGSANLTYTESTGIFNANSIQISTNSAAPNATTNVAAIVAAGANTNYDLTLHPKGTGALLADLPDGTATGGNKRGINAIDLQLSRSLNTQVASGSTSIIIGGINNTASGEGSIVLGGQSNIAGGRYSAVFGGSGGSTRGITGYNVFPSGLPSIAIPLIQTGKLILYRNTTTTNQSILTSEGAVNASATNQLFVAPNTKIIFKASLVGSNNNTQNNTADNAARVFYGCVFRSGTNNIQLLGGNITTLFTSGNITFGVAVNTTLQTLQISVTPATTATRKYVCYLETTEFTF